MREGGGGLYQKHIHMSRHGDRVTADTLVYAPNERTLFLTHLFSCLFMVREAREVSLSVSLSISHLYTTQNNIAILRQLWRGGY